MRFVHSGVIGEITSLPGSSQVCIFHDVFVPPELRGHGLGKAAHVERLEEAKRLGYQLVICTVVVGNEPQEYILLHNGWSGGESFVSDKTGHRVRLWSKVL